MTSQIFLLPTKKAMHPISVRQLERHTGGQVVINSKNKPILNLGERVNHGFNFEPTDGPRAA